MLIISTPSYYNDIQEDVDRPYLTINKKCHIIYTVAIKWTETNMYKDQAKRNTSQRNK